MKREYRTWQSRALSRDMELLVFGDRGTPVIVFPTSRGRFYQFEDFGLVGHVAGRIEEGELQLWCVDSVDAESFYDRTKEPADRVRRHFAYERYVLDELVPVISAENPATSRWLLGCSFGAFHGATFVLRHPEIASKVVCLSGAYDSSRWLDGRRDGDCYFVNPLAFLPDLTDERYLGPLRRVEIVIATGDEDPNVEESRALAGLLQAKGIPAALHVWPGWQHDWQYWMSMMDAFL